MEQAEEVAQEDTSNDSSSEMYVENFENHVFEFSRKKLRKAH